MKRKCLLYDIDEPVVKRGKSRIDFDIFYFDYDDCKRRKGMSFRVEHVEHIDTSTLEDTSFWEKYCE